MEAQGRAESLDRLWSRGRTSLRTSVGNRADRWQSKSWQIGQCAIAAGVAWFIAHDVVGHTTPFFAPIAAVLCLGTSYGQRLRRVAEVTVGVAVGVFLADLIVAGIGSGWWQLTIIVALAMSTAVLLDGGQLFMMQAAVQSIVVATLVVDPGAALTRWTDAVVGGLVALVAATVVPAAPLRRPREQAARVVRKVAELLRAAGDVMDEGEVDHALDLLADARSTDHYVTELRAAADEGLAVVASSPFRIRHKPGMRRMVDLVDPIDRALRSTRVLVRRTAVTAYRGRPVPPSYARLCRDLADAADVVSRELMADRMAVAARPVLLAVGDATGRVERTADLNTDVLLAQIRSVVADLLLLTGLDELESTDALPPPPERAGMTRWVLHVDLDMFLAAVEILRKPELAGKPVVVGGRGIVNERAVVSTASYEAREFGIRSGMPLRTAYKKCPDAVFLPVDAPHYLAASAEVMAALRGLEWGGVPVVLEVLGWDEAFLGPGEGHGDLGDPWDMAMVVRNAVLERTRLHCSVGIGNNKLQAKIATDFGKPRGTYAITDDTWYAEMGARPTRALWGVGAKIAGRLVGAGHRDGDRPGDLGHRAAGGGVRADDGAVVPPDGPRRRLLARRRDAVGGAGARPRGDLPAGPHVGGGTGRGADPGGPRGRGHRRRGPAGDARAPQDPLPQLLHPHPLPQAAGADQRPRAAGRRRGRAAREGRAGQARAPARREVRDGAAGGWLRALTAE